VELFGREEMCHTTVFLCVQNTRGFNIKQIQLEILALADFSIPLV
jgi:hypothetical protein